MSLILEIIVRFLWSGVEGAGKEFGKDTLTSLNKQVKALSLKLRDKKRDIYDRVSDLKFEEKENIAEKEKQLAKELEETSSKPENKDIMDIIKEIEKTMETEKDDSKSIASFYGEIRNSQVNVIGEMTGNAQISQVINPENDRQE